MQDRLSRVTVPHTSSCPNCGEPTFPRQKFCGMCGKSIVLRDETQILEDTVPASVSPGVSVSASENLGRAFLNLIVPRTPLIKVTNTVYEKLSPVSLFGSICF